ncbi:MAG: ATP:cob(I)alamin adenosyltransferase, partial [Pseudomonadota bacterium]
MADRLTKITTKGGDGGKTSLGDGARVEKSDPRVSLMGDVDELNSWIGVALSAEPGETVRETLVGVQHDLFDLGGALCFPGAPILSEAHVARLDAAGEALNADLAPLKEFVLPGGAPLIAWL